jgi:hypothetical protein
LVDFFAPGLQRVIVKATAESIDANKADAKNFGGIAIENRRRRHRPKYAERLPAGPTRIRDCRKPRALGILIAPIP